MSVLIETSLGEIVIDLYSNKCPLTCKNFLKLCKIKYYHGCLFQTVQKDFVAQTGDPTGTGCGGDSIYKFLIGEQARFFGDEIHHDLTHSKTGTVAMASGGENLNASQFYITLGDNLNYLDGKHTVFGEIAEGFDTLTRINEAYVDAENRPYQSIRIKHTYILEDPFEDPRKLAKMIPEQEVKDDLRLEDVWVPLDEALGPEELDELIREKAAHSSAVVLESIGDIPEAEVKPPENVLYVCKLNPVTEDEDLHTIFSKFGTVVSAKVIRDAKTGDSFRYAFIEFEKKEACEKAYNCFKMNNAPTIDDRRIHVDFSQSVSKPWPKLRHKGKENGGFKRCAADHQSSEYTVQDENRGGEVYDIVFEGESPKSKKRDHSHEREKIRRRSFQGYGDGKRRRKDERVAEDKADKYNGRRKRPEEVREETQREKRKRQKGR